ncbi:MAG: serine/threonine protein kinase [Deltaproteobacteria bacterium]|nr:serine/threonine protein kinase [Deltaproteobacteria bacterium]
MPSDPSQNATEAADPLIGQVVAGRFKVKRLLDRGGMGKVYLAEQVPLGRTVALKTLNMADPSGEYKQRFFLEASHASKLTHSNTVRIFDYGATGEGLYFIAMEYLEGRSLDRVIKTAAPLDPLRVVHIAQQVCGALDEAHGAGLVHRDLKPGNIFLIRNGDDEDFAKLLDFGLVKDLGKDSGLSRTDMVLGSPHYISPEQVEARPVDARTDIYALGVILYHALAGQLPFSARNVLAMMMQHASKPPPTFAEKDANLKVPANLEALVRKCMSKAPDQRPASMRELRRGLLACERELRGAVPSFTLSFDGGAVVVPDGVLPEDLRGHKPPPAPPPSEAISEPSPRTGELSSATLSHTLSQSLVIPVRVATSGAALFVMLALGLGFAVLSGAAAWYLVQTPAAPPPAEAAVSLRAVTVVSDPVGAEVTRGYDLLGKTPLTLALPEGEVWELDLSAPGFVTKTVWVDGSRARLTLALEPTGL